MKKKTISLTIVFAEILSVAALLFSGCAGQSGATSKTGGNQNTVENILSQGIAEAEQGDKEQSATEKQTDEEEQSEEDQLEEQSDAEDEPEADAQADDSVDVDLTVLSSTLVYSEVYNMMCDPDEYIGKTVKMEGLFSYYHDDSTGKDYYACIIQDATACCAQGIEFVLTDDYKYPDDYPEPGGEICVAGTFETYSEGNFIFMNLKDAWIAD